MEDLKALFANARDPVQFIILKKLIGIEKSLEKKVTYLSVEDAVSQFRAYLSTKKKPKGYNYVIDLIERDFSGRNIAEITAEEMETFVNRHWSSGKNNSRVRYAQLNGLFNCTILSLKRKGSPVFHNPMQLLVKPSSEPNENEFISVDVIRKILNSPKLEKHKIWLGMLVTSGMRWEELHKLTVRDINGQVLTLLDPKSGRKTETAVILLSLSERLQKYIFETALRPHEQVCPISHTSFNEFTLRFSPLRS